MKSNEKTIFDDLTEGRIYCVETERHNIPLYGKLIRAEGNFVTVERVDGRQVSVKKSAIIAISETRNQQYSTAGVV